GMVTLAGTVTTDGLALDSVTTVPPLGDGPFRVTVPAIGLPPLALPLNVTAPSSGKSVMSAADVEPLNAAEILTAVAAVTPLVALGNVAVVWPAGTVTLAGIVMGTVPVPPFENDFDSVTTAPPVGAALESVTVPVAAEPPTTLVGLIAT